MKINLHLIVFFFFFFYTLTQYMYNVEKHRDRIDKFFVESSMPIDLFSQRKQQKIKVNNFAL